MTTFIFISNQLQTHTSMIYHMYVHVLLRALSKFHVWVIFFIR